jgi:hypothetical protein
MPDLIPAKDGIVDRHPVLGNLKKPGFRVKPGMTKQGRPFIRYFVIDCAESSEISLNPSPLTGEAFGWG